MINELNPSILIPVAQYETWTYTIEATENLWSMTDNAPGHIADRETRLAQDIQNRNANNPDIGYLFH